MTTQQAEALRLADICATKGLFAVEDELRRLHAESEQHLQELRSYRFTVDNLRERVAELEQDAARYQALVKSGNFAPSPFDNGMWGLRASSAPSTKAELDAAVDRVIAAQAKHGDQA